MELLGPTLIIGFALFVVWFLLRRKPRQTVETKRPQTAETKPPQTVETLQSEVSAEPSAPAFDDPEDGVRWKLVHSLRAALAEVMAKNSQCFERAEDVDKAFAVANTEFFNGVRQQESSKAAFRSSGEDAERRLVGLLGDLREVTVAAQNKWKDLQFLLPGSEHDSKKISDWCMSHGVDSEVLSYVLSYGFVVNTDYGLTRDSFWAENERVLAVMRNASD